MPPIYTEMCRHDCSIPQKVWHVNVPEDRLFWCEKCQNDDSSTLCPAIGCRLWPVAYCVGLNPSIFEGRKGSSQIFRNRRCGFHCWTLRLTAFTNEDSYLN